MSPILDRITGTYHETGEHKSQLQNTKVNASWSEYWIYFESCLRLKQENKGN